MKLYNCTIYQNNTLVRKLIPSKDGSTICLWDEVSETYYKNAGSGGNFSGTIAAAKMAKKIYIGVNNVAKKVKKGYIGVNGVAKWSRPTNNNRYWLQYFFIYGFKCCSLLC